MITTYIQICNCPFNTVYTQLIHFITVVGVGARRNLKKKKNIKIEYISKT